MDPCLGSVGTARGCDSRRLRYRSLRVQPEQELLIAQYSPLDSTTGARRQRGVNAASARLVDAVDGSRGRLIRSIHAACSSRCVRRDRARRPCGSDRSTLRSSCRVEAASARPERTHRDLRVPHARAPWSVRAALLPPRTSPQRGNQRPPCHRTLPGGPLDCAWRHRGRLVERCRVSRRGAAHGQHSSACRWPRNAHCAARRGRAVRVAPTSAPKCGATPKSHCCCSGSPRSKRRPGGEQGARLVAHSCRPTSLCNPPVWAGASQEQSLGAYSADTPRCSSNQATIALAARSPSSPRKPWAAPSITISSEVTFASSKAALIRSLLPSGTSASRSP